MKKFRFFLAASAASIAFSPFVASTAYAQETTAGISGQVVDPAGMAISGAKITVVHTPSGTTANGTSDSTGSFNLRGLRVGGPYTVTVTAPSYASNTVEGLRLTVGETLGVPIQLSEQEIVVTGSTTGARELVQGSQSSFDSDEIRNIVSARRDVRDIVRRDPLAAYNPNVGGVTIAGGNIRTQRFSVDGVQMQDSFGLNYGGLPSTRGIVSIEAIDQLTVKAAPFDISEGNFQGGAVNVVLKAGTNDYHITAFGNFGGPKLTGKRTRDNRILEGGSKAVGNTTIYDFKNWGASVSGPIFKDKLFFALAYEQLEESAPNTFGVTGSSAANVVPNLSQAQVDDVLARYGASGYDKYTMGTVPAALAENDKKYSAKLDWNIMDGQRFSVSYIHHENTLPNFATGASTGSTSTSTPYIQLQSNLYQLSEYTDAVSGQWNSQWTDALSSEVRVAYKYYKRGQDAFFGPDFAQFAVCVDPVATGGLSTNGATLCSNGTPFVRMGPDSPRQANKFNNKQLTLSANMQLRAGDHTFKLQLDHFHTSLYNLFVLGATGGTGTTGTTPGGSGAYWFDSLTDFSNRQATEFTLGTTTTGNKNDGFVNWTYRVNTVGIQDTWKPSNALTINAGLRVDLYDSDDAIAFNPNFASRFSTLYPGLTNTTTLNGLDKIQPRFGFNWSPDRSFRLSGGVGLFAGGLSDVFISNNYSNSGAAINALGAKIVAVDFLRTGGTAAAPTCIDRSNPSVTVTNALCATALTNVGGSAVPQAIIDYIKQNAGVTASANTNSLDPKFQIPGQWKYNLSARWAPYLGEGILASGWSFRADVLYSKAQNALRWTDLRSQPLVTAGVVQMAPDGRPRYGGNVGTGAPGSGVDIQLTNTTLGRAWVWSLGLTKELGDFDLTTSYTRQSVKDIAGILTSSTVSSSYSIPTSDPNSGGDYGRSMFEVKHTFRSNLNFAHKFFGDNETRLGVNWELRSGQPFSLVMLDGSGRGPTFGTTNTSSHLLYVPDFNQAATSVTLTDSLGVSYAATKYGSVVFGSSLTPTAAAPATTAQHQASVAAMVASMQALVNATALKGYQGKIVPKNLLDGPWYNKVDINVSQQIPFFFRSKITALFGIENFLNLLNRDWGNYQDYGTTQTVVRVACTGATTAGQTCPNYLYTNYSSPTTQSYSKASLWAIRVGVRLDF